MTSIVSGAVFQLALMFVFRGLFQKSLTGHLTEGEIMDWATFISDSPSVLSESTRLVLAREEDSLQGKETGIATERLLATLQRPCPIMVQEIEDFRIPDQLVLAGVRYCLGRQSTAPFLYAEFLSAVWTDLAEGTQQTIRSHIQKAIAAGSAGAPCDVNIWASFPMTALPPLIHRRWLGEGTLSQFTLAPASLLGQV